MKPVAYERRGRAIVCGAARVQSTSTNRKLSPVIMAPLGKNEVVRVVSGHKFAGRPKAVGPFCAATFVSIEATCSSACPFKGAGCYVQEGFTGRSVRMLDELARGRRPFDVALDEVLAIDGTFPRGVPQDGARGGRDLRLHDAGDVPTMGAAILLGEAARRWKKRGGGSVWTYTHAWRAIDRSSWGPDVSVLASVERPDEIRQARAQGYAPAIVVERHESPRSYFLGSTRIIPCPAETVGTTCVQCRLCLDRDLYAMRAGIAFAAHGATTKTLVALRARNPEEVATA